MKRLTLFALSTVLAIGCGTDAQTGPEVLPGLHLPPPPDPGKGWQIIGSVIDNLQPGSDTEMCTWTDIITDRVIDVKSTVGVQTEPPGHHIVVYYTTMHQPPGTQRVCQDADMITFRFLSGTGGEGVPSSAPGNLVFRVPAGAQIVFNHHYLNATDRVLRGQSAVNVNFAEPGNWTPVGNIAMLNTDLQIPPGPYSMDIHCVMPTTMKFWELLPHMHQWGTHATLAITQSGVKSTLYDAPWDPSYAFHPPITYADPSAPIILNTGDAVDYHCEWNNTTTMPLNFGLEMCVAFGATVDDMGVGSKACSQGSWFPF
jgi:hypothetical protein